jgi:type II secretory pathway pseudopilin PulG
MAEQTSKRLFYNEDGFTFLTLLFVVAVMGIMLSATGEVWSTVAKREKEKELLFRGTQIHNAIKSYYELSPGIKRYPKELSELLEDKRSPVPRHHLRRLYKDPFALKVSKVNKETDKKGEVSVSGWALIRGTDKRIKGVKSMSSEEPIKRAGFAVVFETFAGAASYSDWEFTYTPIKDSTRKSRGGLGKRSAGNIN